MGNVKSNLKSRGILTSSSKKYTKKRNELQQIEQSEQPVQPEEPKEPTYHLSNHGNDDIDRQHFNHFFRKHLFQNNFSAPIEEKLIQGRCKVLDTGCGPGTWLLDLATKYENSRFFGIDIKPVYPIEIKPKNLEFYEADILNNLPFPDNEFDFVHQEIMALIIKKVEWPRVISELIRITRPGGFIEIVEYISPDKNGPVMTEMYDTHTKMCSERDIDTSLTPHLDKIILSHPLITKVNKDIKTFIIGPNGGGAGTTILDILLTFNISDSATENISRFLGITKEEYTNKIAKINEELVNTKPELSVCRFWAQKNQSFIRMV
ncbi:unnamed protein product [Rhizophagus irregularis]|uniref:Methyltransferase domain-containing protein n=2 Tax=Rhizophagus irregularis TaxID=588596 RepID=A0A916EGE8_9GLOM|nr:unnamed protein product [Rhizophagus irregularis]CAB5217112.1 unnamed protein product [Rhizophagus irregularis]CAB5380425.1 unnamed protein product [Rhizophagus irregularis]